MNRTSASLILFGAAVAILAADAVGVAVLSGGYDLISSRLHDQLAALALLSLPFTLVLAVAGSALGILDWRTARKAARPPARATVAAAVLNVALVSLEVGAFVLIMAAYSPYG